MSTSLRKAHIHVKRAQSLIEQSSNYGFGGHPRKKTKDEVPATTILGRKHDIEGHDIVSKVVRQETEKNYISHAIAFALQEKKRIIFFKNDKYPWVRDFALETWTHNDNTDAIIKNKHTIEEKKSVWKQLHDTYSTFENDYIFFETTTSPGSMHYFVALEHIKIAFMDLLDRLVGAFIELNDLSNEKRGTHTVAMIGHPEYRASYRIFDSSHLDGVIHPCAEFPKLYEAGHWYATKVTYVFQPSTVRRSDWVCG